MNRRLLAMLLLVFVTLAVIAAPVNFDEDILEARAKKAAVKAKPVAKSKPIAKPVAKPKPVSKPVAAKKPVAKPKPVAAKKPVVKPKPVAKPVAAKKPVAKPKPVAAKKPVKSVAKPVAKPTAAPKKAVPAASCPLPARKPAVRRFLEFIGLARSTNDPACPTTEPASTPSTSTTSTSSKEKDKGKLSKAQRKKLKNAGKSGQAAPPTNPQVAPQPASVSASASASASALPAKRPVGKVTNPPTKGVKCLDRNNIKTKVELADINKAVALAQAGPLQDSVIDGRIKLFPHRFLNTEGVKIAAACQGKKLEEHAVGDNMNGFRNNVNIIPLYPFRVVITTPDANGDTTFCGVMTHGATRNGDFLQDLCQ